MVTILKFSAEWCRPCKSYGPIVREAVQGREGVELQEIDIEQSPELAQQYGIKSVPTTIFLRGGNPVGQFTGGTTKKKLDSLRDAFAQ